jgi:hypothetical protein
MPIYPILESDVGIGLLSSATNKLEKRIRSNKENLTENILGTTN